MQLVIAVWISVTDIDNEGEQIVIMDRPGNNRKDQEKEAHHCHAPNQLNTIIYQIHKKNMTPFPCEPVSLLGKIIQLSNKSQYHVRLK